MLLQRKVSSAMVIMSESVVKPFIVRIKLSITVMVSSPVTLTSRVIFPESLAVGVPWKVAVPVLKLNQLGREPPPTPVALYVRLSPENAFAGIWKDHAAKTDQSWSDMPAFIAVGVVASICMLVIVLARP